MNAVERKECIVWFLNKYVAPFYMSSRAKEFIEEHCFPLLDTKGHDYTQGSADVNNNFKRAASRLEGRGFDMFDIWAVYFFKHVDALETFVQDRSVKSEPVEGRIADSINYALILVTLLKETDSLTKNLEVMIAQWVSHLLDLVVLLEEF